MSDAVTPIERRTFAEAGSSTEAFEHYRGSKLRQKRWRRNKRLGLHIRTVRLPDRQISKFIELGYLAASNRGNQVAEGIAVEAFLADSL
jgi:hypothetical protein